jgi:uncharacterized protein YutE (UPF0331/DUF86 family)
MTSDKINGNVIVQRAAWIHKMLDSIRDLPLQTREDFINNKHNIAAAESYLRRALEALFDIGRHILAKKFAHPAAEYKEIADGLFEKKVLAKHDAEILRQMAGYRNRMVHFYHEIGPEELYDICTTHLDEIHLLLTKLAKWTRKDLKLKQ